MRIVNSLDNAKIFKCDNDTAKLLFEKLNILPINEFYSESLGKDVNIFILSKKLEAFLVENNLEVDYE